MFQKIINFVKYHNAFTIGLALTFVFSGAIFASDTVREATIGKPVVEQQGIDNSTILAADLDSFDFGMTIIGVSEDTQNYYVDYVYQSLAIRDNVWQTLSRQATLTVSKSALADRDLGLYVAKELGEIVDCELAYLKEVQEKEREKGQTFVQETTKYTGLIGLVLNPKTKELPGYEPVVKPPEPAPVVYTEPEPRLPPAPESFIEPTPETQSQSIPQPAPRDVCDATHLNLCQNEADCQTAGGYWSNETCNSESESAQPAQDTCDATHLNLCSTQADCENVGGYWYNETCNTEPEEELEEAVCDNEHLDLCTTQELCDGAGLYWYNNACNLEPETPACTPDWSCTDWQPLPETQACGQTFSQTRTCTDSNECGTKEGKPAETQEATGTFCSAQNAIGTCQADGTCSFICQDGFLNCDDDWSNGCEFTATSTCPTAE